MSDPFKIIEPTVISFSGGRTSAYMLWRVLQSNGGLPDEAIVVFANTSKEEEATLEFVRDCSVNWDVLITWLEYQTEQPNFRVVNFETASRNGEPFQNLILKRKYLPNPVTRFCTSELKVRPIHKYVKSLGWDHNEKMDWVGIRADEQRRAAKIDRDRTPLVAAGITKEDVGNFWRNQSFDLGLPNMNGVTMHGNCDLCFLKGAKQTYSLIEEKPERALWWAKMETLVQTKERTFGDGDRFRKDRPSYQQMHDYAKSQKTLDMFDDETIPCFCGD
jgi:3'-phosphoadenosine 5'-phosphosulfate sulfotransferase (PAPS reductase)/FAD synthetase